MPNRLDLKSAVENKSREGKKDNEAEKGCNEWRSDYGKEKNWKERSAIETSGFYKHNGQFVDEMMLDGGTTSPISFQID